MCLNKAKWMGFTEHDLIVYKFIRILDGRLVTPYRNSPIMLGETYVSKLDSSSEYGYYCFEGSRITCINKGLHSFNNLEDVKYMVKQYVIHNPNIDLQFKIIECVIPKGSKFYMGTFRSFCSYCSDKIIYGETFIN